MKLPESERVYEVTLVSYDEMFEDGFSPVEFRVGYYSDYHEAVIALVNADMHPECKGYLKRRYPNGKANVILARYE